MTSKKIKAEAFYKTEFLKYSALGVSGREILIPTKILRKGILTCCSTNKTITVLPLVRMLGVRAVWLPNSISYSLNGKLLYSVNFSRAMLQDYTYGSEFYVVVWDSKALQYFKDIDSFNRVLALPTHLSCYIH